MGRNGPPPVIRIECASHNNPPYARFCGQCGKSLYKSFRPIATPAPPPSRAEVIRRAKANTVRLLGREVI